MAGSVAQKALAEVVGSFLFSFVTAAAVIADVWSGGALGLQGIALVHGLSLAAVVAALSPVSGGHVNPAVTVAWTLAGRMTWSRALLYVLAQLLGGVLAAVAAATAFPAAVWQRARLGLLPAQSELTLWQLILIEAALTLAVALVYFGARIGDGQRPAAALAAGAAAAAGVFVAAPLTGAALSPARSFGIALAGNLWENQWLHWVGPLAGAAAAAVIGSLLRVRERETKE